MRIHWILFRIKDPALCAAISNYLREGSETKEEFRGTNDQVGIFVSARGQKKLEEYFDDEGDTNRTFKEALEALPRWHAEYLRRVNSEGIC
jgi:hypothetical protein